MAFDVAIFPTAPSPSLLHLYVEPEGFALAPLHGSMTSRQPSLPRSRPPRFPPSFVYFALSHTLAHSRRESANAPDVDVGLSLLPSLSPLVTAFSPLIPHLDAHDRVFGLNPLLVDEIQRGRYATSSSLPCL